MNKKLHLFTMLKYSEQTAQRTTAASGTHCDLGGGFSGNS